MTMLTISAENGPMFRRFHKPEDEKRSVVILADDAWGDWWRCKAAGMLEGQAGVGLVVAPDP